MNISLTAVLAQILNFALLFFLFRKFLTKPIVASIEERRSLIKKLEKAEDAYAEKIAAWDAAYKKKVEQGVAKREKLIAEAGAIADQKKHEILLEAKRKSEEILHDAGLRSKGLEKELQDNFERGVKETSLLVLQKLLQKDKKVKNEYIDTLLKELI